MTLVLLMASAQARADFYEITTPAQMVSCMQSYIQNWIVAPETVSSWEHQPAYIFAGKYVHASWHTSPLFNYGSLGMMLGPKSIVYCDYETKADGIPDMTNTSGLKTALDNADVMFDYMTFENGQQVDSQKKVAVIINSKLLCLNIPRP